MLISQKGFTLIECLAVIGIFAVIHALAVPALKSLLESQFNYNLQQALTGSLNKARSNAITTRSTVELCPGTDQHSCNLNWYDGWYIRSKQSVIETRYNSKPANLRWSGFSKNPKFIADGSTPSSNGKFYLCHREKIAWQIVQQITFATNGLPVIVLFNPHIFCLRTACKALCMLA